LTTAVTYKNSKLPEYKPYQYFIPFHNRSKRYAVLVIHRGGGKSIAAINELIERASYAHPNAHARYAYIAPFKTQAKGIAWDYLKQYSSHCRKNAPSEADLSITLVNGAKIFILGADDPDSLRGKHWNGIVMDEVAQIKRSVYSEIIRPGLARRKGFIVFIGTPKGKHNMFFEQYELAKANPNDYFLLELNVDQTKIIGPQELKEIKDVLNDSEFRQEYMCSFEAAMVGSYYGKQMLALEERKKLVVKELYNHEYPVSLSMDIGRRDETAIWFWQIVGGEIRFIEYIQLQGTDADEVCELLQRKPYAYKDVFLPHDAFHKTFASKKSAFDTFVEYRLPVRKVPNPDFGNSVDQGIDAVRKFLRRWPLIISTLGCATGIEAIKNYSREWHIKLQQFADHPKHDRYSHGADAFRYAVLSISMEDVKRSEEEPERLKPQTSADTDKIKNDRINTILQRRFTFDDALRAHDRRIALQRTERRPRI
jgi:phage terminase large subunit